jgi:hypothetical protein
MQSQRHDLGGATDACSAGHAYAAPASYAADTAYAAAPATEVAAPEPAPVTLQRQRRTQRLA